MKAAAEAVYCWLVLFLWHCAVSPAHPENLLVWNPTPQVWIFSSVLWLEVCTGSKLKPEPGPYPRLSDPTRPDPSGTVKFRARTRPEIPPPSPTNSQQKKKEKGCISRLHAKKQINQGSAISQTFTSYESLWTSGAAVAYILPSLWILYEDNSSTVQIMVIFCQLRLVSILSTLNQT